MRGQSVSCVHVLTNTEKHLNIFLSFHECLLSGYLTKHVSTINDA